VRARRAWVRVQMRQSTIERIHSRMLMAHSDWLARGLDASAPSVHLLHVVEVGGAGG